jgi:hypothetical protein
MCMHVDAAVSHRSPFRSHRLKRTCKSKRSVTTRPLQIDHRQNLLADRLLDNLIDGMRVQTAHADGNTLAVARGRWWDACSNCQRRWRHTHTCSSTWPMVACVSCGRHQHNSQSKVPPQTLKTGVRVVRVVPLFTVVGLRSGPFLGHSVNITNYCLCHCTL